MDAPRESMRLVQKITGCRAVRRAMNDGHGPAGHVWQDPIGDALVVSSELNLRCSVVRVDHSVGCEIRTPTTIGDESPDAGARRLVCLAGAAGVRTRGLSPRVDLAAMRSPERPPASVAES